MGADRRANEHETTNTAWHQVVWTHESITHSLRKFNVDQLARHAELIFYWINKHRRIKGFFGNSENAVKSPIWIAMPVYIPMATSLKRLELPLDLDPVLQIPSPPLFEKTTVGTTE